MKKILFLVPCFLSVFISETQAQKYFQPGYVVTQEGDTLRGEMQVRSNTVLYKKAVLRREGSEQFFLPGEIAGYGFDEGNAFYAIPGMNSFVQVMVLGYLSLYKQDSRYYLTQGEEIVVVSRTEGAGKIILANIFSRCLGSGEEVANARIEDKTMVERVVAYNECHESPSQVLLEELPKVSVEVGAKASWVLGQLYTIEPDENQGILPSRYETSGVGSGVTVGVRFPQISKNVFFETGASWLEQEFEGVEVDSNPFFTEYHRSRIALNYLQFPLFVGFEGSGWPSRFRMKGGPTFLLPLQTEFMQGTDIDDGDGIVPGSWSNPFPLRDFFMGVQAGIAYRYHLGRVAIEAEALYTRTLDLEELSLYSISLQTISGSLVLLWR